MHRKESIDTIYRKLLHFGSWEWEIQTGTLKWSDEIESLFGFRNGEFKKTYEAFLEVIHPDDRELVQKNVQLSIEKQTIYQVEHRIIWPDGSVHWVEEMGSVFYDSENIPVKMIGTVKNIDAINFLKSDLEKYRFELQSKDELVSALLNGLNNHCLVSMTDRQGIITYANEKFCEVSGYSFEELVGTKHSIVNSRKHSKEFWEVFWKTISSGIIFHGMITNKAKDGSEYVVETTVVPVENQGVISRYISIRTEVTQILKDQKELEEYKDHLQKIIEEKTKKLIQTEDQLIHSSKMAALGTMSSGLAHELNNPLFLIDGFCSELKMEFSLNNCLEGEQVADYLNEIDINAKRMKVLVKNFKEFGYQNASQRGFKKIDLFELLNKVQSYFKKQLDMCNILLKIQCPKETQLYGIPSRMEQVIVNILINAKDAIEEQAHKSLLPTIHEASGVISIDVEEKDDVTKIKISDTGIGMTKETINKVFDPFFTTKTISQGTGLGMSITHSIVKEMYGNISIVSEEDLGTEVTIEFSSEMKRMNNGN